MNKEKEIEEIKRIITEILAASSKAKTPYLEFERDWKNLCRASRGVEEKEQK